MLRLVCLLGVCFVATGQTIATQAEYELYSAVAKDFAANQFPQALKDLEAWSAKFPQTNVDAARRSLYVQAYWGSKDAAGPLLLTRDVVILDVWADEGADAVRLTHELELQNRRIFVLTDYFPDLVLKGIVDKDSLAVISRHTIGISEVVKRNQENHHMEVSSPKL